MYCTNCKTLLANAADLCVKCGLAPKSSNRYCSECGHERQAHEEKCPECGIELIYHISNKDGILTFLLALFLGMLGIDRLYTSNLLIGILKMVSLGGLGVWWVYDIYLLVTGNYKDKYGRVVRSESGG